MNAGWGRASNVLAVRLDTLGDVLMTTPAIRALRQGAPGRRVTLLTSTPGAAVADLIPDLDDCLVHDPPWMKATPQRADSRAELELVARLRDRRFDAAVIFTVYSQSPLPAATLCYLADVPLRLAYSRERAYQLLTDEIADPEPAGGVRHEVRRQLDLVAEVGCRTTDERLSLRVPARATGRARRLMAAGGVDRGRPWVLVHPGGSAASRRWPPTSFAAACRALVLEHGWQVVFSGAAAEVPLVEQIRVAMRAPSASLAGRLDVATLAAVIAAAPLLISNNTGPVHIAAACATPVVDLYALTNPQHGPWQVPARVLSHDVPCRWCYKSVCPEGHHRCLRGVVPETVVQAALALAAETGATARAS